ncbi:hypothetical protein P3L10_028093 [Capsicum annuum]|uniref:uncharacterized protein LOC124887728 n=1 Tax=Capsicum annuum TaxID=4072 RepID=UPI001FB16F84|nr:uncharacterized protein LOC124887728 [Capsicum annuum]
MTFFLDWVQFDRSEFNFMKQEQYEKSVARRAARAQMAAAAKQTMKTSADFQVEGTPERPRLYVFRSNKHIYVQVIDDSKMHTLASASTMQKPISEEFDYSAGPTEACQGDLIVGLFMWVHLLLPMLSSKVSSNPQTRDLILQLAERTELPITLKDLCSFSAT